ncbi:MAG: hypothetical protein Q7R47_02750 [Candidatus Diapherotrites archaeon]|nr:hypothetical protein [Candidatus Diapherotrites archaeon]
MNPSLLKITLLTLLAGAGLLFLSACSGENSPQGVPPTASTQEPSKVAEPELPPKVPDQEEPPTETRLPDLSLVLPDDPIPDWINDKPDIKE